MGGFAALKNHTFYNRQEARIDSHLASIQFNVKISAQQM